MIKGEKIWLNGRILNWEEAKIHIISDTFNYGYGVFEGIRCYKSQKGRAIFRLRDHIERLMNSAKVRNGNLVEERFQYDSDIVF
jgi:branched-chain amino acid aminotransferase